MTLLTIVRTVLSTENADSRSPLLLIFGARKWYERRSFMRKRRIFPLIARARKAASLKPTSQLCEERLFRFKRVRVKVDLAVFVSKGCSDLNRKESA
jgi:hypothetical protein